MMMIFIIHSSFITHHSSFIIHHSSSFILGRVAISQLEKDRVGTPSLPPNRCSNCSTKIILGGEEIRVGIPPIPVAKLEVMSDNGRGSEKKSTIQKSKIHHHP